ncbi:HNH endonuclease [Aquabacterium sp. A7-Y]|uniref:HNH endonuclease signature motif containing protein n=1 Tax=Aquabacterium sp. A7-Y TaxID=1349605 RepID=UPI00223DBB2E|nr:HNH endonuclease signature motif containing protein [Aquabacterium sp. A7-Y]MCW7536708.1 HNH endonuclease [Aquabacterium sp. A7-Y]
MARTGRPETPLRQRFLAKFKIDPETQCWNWTAASCPQGYGFLKRKDGVQLRAHRVAYQLYNGEISCGWCVCHRCDNPRCVNPAHLFVGTHKDNAADMVAKGRAARSLGEHNPAARLTADQVRCIRSEIGSHVELGRRFGVSPTQVGLIKRGKRWAHL